MKHFSAIFLVLAFLAMACTLSFSQDVPVKPIVVRINAITPDSDTLWIAGEINVEHFADQWRVDFDLHLEGATIVEAVIERNTVRWSQGVRTVSEKDLVVVGGTRLTIPGLNWPQLSDVGLRGFDIKCKIKDLSPKGVTVLSTSSISADEGRIIQPFSGIPGDTFITLGKLVTSFKPKSRKSPFEPLLADVQFTVKNVNIPKNSGSEVGLTFRDDLKNAKFSGPSSMCIVNGKKTQVVVAPNFLQFKEFKLFQGATTLKVSCPSAVQMTLSNTEKDHIWNFGFRSTDPKNYMASSAQVDFLHPVPKSHLVPILIVVFSLAIILGVTALVLKTAQIGPFKQKSIEERYAVNALPNEEAYVNMD